MTKRHEITPKKTEAKIQNEKIHINICLLPSSYKHAESLCMSKVAQ